MQPHNLLLDISNPLAQYQPVDNCIGEAHTGQQYRDLYAQLVTDPCRQLLVPIIVYLDGTAIDSKGHIELCPVSFTTSLFTEKLRRDVSAWRIWGYVPDLNRGRSNAMNTTANATATNKGRTTRNFHAVMDVIMQGMRAAHDGLEPRLCNVPLKFGNVWFNIDVLCPLLYVINDGKQGDQLCCRFSGHHASTLRHHRSCDCIFDQLDNPFQNCKFLTTSAVANLCATGTEEELRSVSLYRVDNAFNRIEMGPNPHGIFMGAAIDVMHSVQHGLHMYALSAFMKPLGPVLQTKLDLMANVFNDTCRQSIRQNFPRADFARGITNLTQIECSERSGVLFLLTAIIMNEDGWNIVEQANANVASVLRTMECLLCFEAWLDRDTYWEIGDPNNEAMLAGTAIANILLLLKTYLPRTSGHGWKVSKFHEMLHVIRCITAFGAPKGYNASRPESHHKTHAKDHGRRSPKNVETIDRQCGQRVADAFMLNTMHELLHAKERGEELQDTTNANNDDPNETLTESSGKTATHYDICSVRDASSGMLVCTTRFHTKSKAVMRLEPNLDLFVLQYYSAQLTHGEGTVSACTEYHLTNCNREAIITLRCHPNYRGEGAWYDWAVIRFIDDNDESTDYPSRIVACIPKVTLTGNNRNEFDLIVQCCTFKTGRESILYTEWMFDLAFYVVPGSALVSQCFVLKASETEFDRVLVVLDSSMWADQFYAAANLPTD